MNSHSTATPATPAAPAGPTAARQALRRQLLERRAAFVTGAEAEPAGASLIDRLNAVLAQLAPQLLGLYWPFRGEFNAPLAIAADASPSTATTALPTALPFCQRTPVQMHYRRWDGRAPTGVDECRIPCSSGPVVVPDVVLVPCVGFTRDGYRLGYGGGYFDRWLALHPGTTAVGVAWSGSEIAPGGFDPQPHDRALALIVTERGVV